jgi:hypothetical protein
MLRYEYGRHQPQIRLKPVVLSRCSSVSQELQKRQCKDAVMIAEGADPEEVGLSPSDLGSTESSYQAGDHYMVVTRM